MKRVLPAILLCLPSLITAAESVRAQLGGSLFTSPEERAYLDYLREQFLSNNQQQGFDIEVPEIPTPETEEELPAGPVEITFGGVVTSHDGGRSVWLNGQALAESDLPGYVRIVEADGVLQLRLTVDGVAHLLRPGQTLDITSGSVLEGYQRMPAAPDAGSPEFESAEADGLPGAAAEAPAGQEVSTTTDTAAAATGDGNAEADTAILPDDAAPGAPDALEEVPPPTPSQSDIYSYISNLKPDEFAALLQTLARPQDAQEEVQDETAP